MKRIALVLVICLGAGAWAVAQADGGEGLPGKCPGRPRAAAPFRKASLTPEDALRKATVNGKYRMLLRQIMVERDAAAYGEFRDFGPWTGAQYAGHRDLPPGHWVYVRPCWYIWRDLSAEPRPMRSWGPEQATGGPDTPGSGDLVTAWASRTQDSREEWLMLEYEDPMVPQAVEVHETFNPGAIVKVTAFRLDGEEVTLWTGKDPTPIGAPRGESVIPLAADFKTNRVKLYLDSAGVPGWNEIDAAGLIDAGNKTHWATAAHASSTYAEPGLIAPPNSVDPPPAPAPVPEAVEQRLLRLEAEVTRQAEIIRKLAQQLRELHRAK